MAAHVFTALKQIESETTPSFPSLQAALDFACWTEDLSLDHYLELANIVKSGDQADLRQFVERCLPIYQAEWERYDQPATREEWLRRKYDL